MDLLLEHGAGLYAVEVKAGATIASDYFTRLSRLSALMAGRVTAGAVVYGGDSAQPRSRFQVVPALSRDRLFSGWSSEPPPRRSSRRQVLKGFEILPGRWVCSIFEHTGSIASIMLADEDRYRILKRLAEDPDASQRALAQELGISLGKVNYCLNALIEKGLLKINNFRTSDNKRAYMYYLTPKGAQEKAKVTVRFLRHKLAQFESLKGEIEQLKRESESEGATHRHG